jgi:hypothetical protein
MMIIISAVDIDDIQESIRRKLWKEDRTKGRTVTTEWSQLTRREKKKLTIWAA